MIEYKTPELTYWERIKTDLNRTHPSPEFLQWLEKLGPNRLKPEEERIHIEIKPSSKK